jgi:hypothetical protein
MLVRFWVRFRGTPDEVWPCILGCGVTAYSLDDAMLLIKKTVYPDRPVPSIDSIIEGIDVSSLDANHVLPNIGVPARLGVWYPNRQG